MVTHIVDSNRDVFHAIADPTRRAILDRLSGAEIPAGEIAGGFSVSRPAVSKHLRVLREAGLIEEAKMGRHRVYKLQPDRLREVDRWLIEYRRFWEASLLGLKELLESQLEKEK